MKMELQTVIGIIRNLATKTVDRGCTEAEMLSAMTKIDQLMRVYNLTMDKVFIEETSCVQKEIVTKHKNQTVMGTVLTELCCHFGTKVWRSRGQNRNCVYKVFGLDPDVIMVVYLYDVISSAMENETARYKTTSEYTLRYGHGKSSVVAFQKGFGRRIKLRIAAMAAEQKAESLNVPVNALIAVKNQKVEDEFSKLGMKLKTTYRRSGFVRDSRAYAAGQSAADRVNLNRPLGGNVGGYLN